ncbi:MAG: histidinol dehydrogenase [Candidatus Altiarchaeales archaeon]|nr:MAG: histidinol dehydrogenase [Candidatus Altiarchaeales archaeon]
MRIVNYENKREIERVIERSLDLESVFDIVRPILRDVKENGDSALIEYTKRFDNFDLISENIKISENEIMDAYSNVSDPFLSAIRHAHKNIEKFHREQFKQIKKSWKIETEKGISITEKIAAIESIGAYVPGGIASYPSTVLMTCIPAKIANVERIVVVSPPPISPAVLVACDLCGVNEIYRVGGAQAIAALAYGTESVRRVDKIIGPGNRYVMAAKLLVFGIVTIDMPAGPSEVLIIADSEANPRFIAADILAQAEHDPDAQCILVTDSKEIADEVDNEIKNQIEDLKRREVITQSLENSYLVLTRDMNEAIEFSNLYAPEHLEIMTKNPEEIAEKIKNAGAIFLGNYSPVPAGDYASGGNHVLPTGGTARFSSELGVRDFLRCYSIQKISKVGLSRLRKTIETLAEVETLDAHSNAVKKRF